MLEKRLAAAFVVKQWVPVWPRRSHTDHQHRQVCNHLFSPPEGPIFVPKRQSVLMQGWQWSKKNIQPVTRKTICKGTGELEQPIIGRLMNIVECGISSIQYKKRYEGVDVLSFCRQRARSTISDHVGSRSTDSMTTYHTTQDLPYAQVSILDNNQNYKRYELETTTISNIYSLRDEVKREIPLNKQDLVNNNLVSPDATPPHTPLISIHTW
ncbi:hypothetical protein DICVIV_00686 [Dictyocaulus viviparus]|uniref:Uncharacterized protein n=1 Tax=Dictyocaulus viviparus TaxID=29172 RepID=A0A0D8Y8P4_DICVI|nr:hypothetical protein DICVIV_00686 [Dictyocaulus viviparus]